MAKSKRVAEPTLAEKIAGHLRARELGRKHYKRSDRLLDEIVREIKPGQEIEVKLGSRGRKVKLKDLYASENKVFRSHGIGRYELEVIEG